MQVKYFFEILLNKFLQHSFFDIELTSNVLIFVFCFVDYIYYDNSKRWNPAGIHRKKRPEKIQ